MNKNKEVIKHSSAIQITNNISFLQRRAWNVLLSIAYDDLMRKDKFYISVRDLSELLGFDSKNDDYLKETLEQLTRTTVTWNILGKDKKSEWGVFPLLAGCVVNQGVVAYAFSPFLKDKLHKPNMYARFSLSSQNSLHSKHALALYELCLDYYDAQRRYGETSFLSVLEFRSLMGLTENEYPEFYKLNEKVIKKALQDINSMGDVKVEVKFRRESRSVTGLKFCISRPEIVASSAEVLLKKMNILAREKDIEEINTRFDEVFSELPENTRASIMEKATSRLDNFVRSFIGTEMEEKAVTPLLYRERNLILAEEFPEKFE